MNCELKLVDGEERYVIVDIIGAGEDLGVENLKGSGAIAGEVRGCVYVPPNVMFSRCAYARMHASKGLADCTSPYMHTFAQLHVDTPYLV